jgi:CRP-like cAMP-binding protein
MVNVKLFVNLVPLQSLREADQLTLAKQSSVLSFSAGQVAFTRGEMARNQAYLISGELELQLEHSSSSLRADEVGARFPLASGNRRSATALCLKPSEILFVDRELLDLLLTWSQTGSSDAKRTQTQTTTSAQDSSTQESRGSGTTDESDEIDTVHRDSEPNEWMTSLLQSKAFLRIPAANIAQIFASMEAISFAPGQTIIQQGTPGDFYYVVTDGRVQVVLESQGRHEEEELAQLGAGKAFGEEALVSGAPRNASVRALTRCSLMRLSSAAFTKLLRAPLLQEVNAHDHTDQQWLDVRVPEEFHHGHLAGAINLPLNELRQSAKKLNQSAEYWVYCDTGRRSASAVYLLTERGFNARLVRGGVPVEALNETT